MLMSNSRRQLSHKNNDLFVGKRKKQSIVDFSSVMQKQKQVWLMQNINIVINTLVVIILVMFLIKSRRRDLTWKYEMV
jgi:hypothetical protein